MPIEIAGITYFTATDILRELGPTRQTLWRWRKNRSIPQGRRYRGRQVVFTKQELDAIRQYAHRLEPAEPHQFRRPKRTSSSSYKRSER
jgi:predicted DNA-binding transcriptional regulator AlpA